MDVNSPAAGSAIGVVMVAVFVLFGAGFLGLMIWLIVWQYRKTKARIAAVVAFATRHGFAYIPKSPERVTYFRSDPFGKGLNRSVSHVVAGSLQGVTFETFAYLYQTQHTDSKGHTRTQNHPYQVTWIPMPGPLPMMRLTADNALWRLGRSLGARDLDTESEEFNTRWKVWCADERIGHAVLTPTMIELLLRRELWGRAFVIEGNALMSYSKGHTNLSEIPWLVYTLNEMVDRIPPFLFEPHQP